jgi:hypothetical protein
MNAAPFISEPNAARADQTASASPAQNSAMPAIAPRCRTGRANSVRMSSAASSNTASLARQPARPCSRARYRDASQNAAANAGTGMTAQGSVKSIGTPGRPRLSQAMDAAHPYSASIACSMPVSVVTRTIAARRVAPLAWRTSASSRIPPVEDKPLNPAATTAVSRRRPSS